MELKDMILSTLAELEDVKEEVEEEVQDKIEEKVMEPLIKEEKIEEVPFSEQEEVSPVKNIYEDERHFCESMRERILVLFEGFQSPTNKSIEAKVDLTLNFLEYLLAVVDERLESLDKK